MQTQTNSPYRYSATALGWTICIFGMIFYGYEFLLRIAPSVMEPQLRDFFNISASGFGTLVGVYYFVYTPMQLFVGPAVDVYGPRRILTFATVMCALGTLIFCSTHNMWIAGIGRFFIGFGSAFAFVGALKLASVWLPVNRFATFAGLVTALGMFGGMVGDIGLTSLVQHVGWQKTMFYGVIFGVFLAPLIAIVVRDRPKDVDKVPVRHLQVFKELFKIMRNRDVWLSGLVACMLYMSLSAFAEIWSIPFLRTTFAFTPHQAAIANSMVFLGWLIGGPLSGFISDRLGNRRKPLIVGGLLAALSISSIIYLPHHSVFVVGALLLCFGLFCGSQIICFAIGRESAPQFVSATAVAFVNMLTMLGGFVFQPLIGKFLDLSWSGQRTAEGLRLYTAHDYRVALTALPLAMIVGVVLTLIMRETYKNFHG